MFSKYLIIGFVLASMAGFAAHKFIVGRLETDIAKQTTLAEERLAHNVTLQTAADINKKTIDSLTTKFEYQNEMIGTLQSNLTTLEQQRDKYLSIFRKHDLTALARKKPGLIETRINNGTREVFDELRITTDTTPPVEEENENSEDN